ncbi:sortilin-like isoform X3 [Channa argus]|uniref:sortilin-like isoform X3 n=1 Tax=Channa argus TaxID=215402 RepID=UPI00352139BA
MSFSQCPNLGSVPVNMMSMSCVLALGLFWSALGTDFQEEVKMSGLNRLLRAVDEERRSLETSNLSKRSTGLNEQTCTALPAIESTLQNSTNTFTFKMRNMGLLSLAWVGDGSGVLLVLTTFQVPLFTMHFGQSNLYRSEDYGKTFKDVTHLINHTFILSEFGIAISPDHSGKLILTGDVSETGGFRLFRSQDFGMTFVPTVLPFEPLIQMLYNPVDCNALLTLSIKLDLWISEDFGATWRKIHDHVCLVRWGPKNSIYFTTNYNESCNDNGNLELRKTTDYGRSFVTIATRVYSFVLGGKFVFASIMTGKGTERLIHVSVDGGEVWNIAQLPTVNHEQFYSILAATQDMIFMHVDDPGDSGVGTLYVSDDRGTVFSKSLEHHLYTTTSDTDFSAISSLRGVYMTSVLTDDAAVETVITFDQGAKWQTLRRPQNSHCDTETSSNRPNRCSLYIHASYSINMKMDVPMLPLSQPSAVGLILAHGSVGDAESTVSPDVYVSDDGGYSWHLALRGPHHYAILDSGGLLVAVEHTNLPVNQINDFGYYRPENSTECVEQEEMKEHPLEFCLNGTTDQLQTSGYRKIPGDQCEGGFQPERKEINLGRICTSNVLHPISLSETSLPNAGVIVMVVIVILLSSGVAGVWLVKKYVCGGRFLVHRYSVMREHVEANKIEGVDDIDAQYMETAKAEYNEDSDQYPLVAGGLSSSVATSHIASLYS